MPPEDSIHFIMTGGTIDSYYEISKDTVMPLENSIIPGFLSALKLYDKIAFTQICMKDSRDLDKSDLKKILDNVDKSPHKMIIITHGTYTMPDTARYLESNLKRKDKTIILTGSMIPIEGFAPSDAPFNLGFAIAKVHDLAPGIYVGMNGRVFDVHEVKKKVDEGRFISIFGENKRKG